MSTKYKSNSKLPGVFEWLKTFPWLQYQSAKFAAHKPKYLSRVEHWQDKLRSLQTAGKQFHMTPQEREAMLSLFMLKFIALDDQFFADTAEAIRFYKKRNPQTEDILRRKLSDPAFLAKDADSTATQIAERVGYKGDMEVFRRILRKMGRKYRSGKQGPKAKYFLPVVTPIRRSQILAQNRPNQTAAVTVQKTAVADLQGSSGT